LLPDDAVLDFSQGLVAYRFGFMKRTLDASAGFSAQEACRIVRRVAHIAP
jgi:hypothetical protein